MTPASASRNIGGEDLTSEIDRSAITHKPPPCRMTLRNRAVAPPQVVEISQVGVDLQPSAHAHDCDVRIPPFPRCSGESKRSGTDPAFWFLSPFRDLELLIGGVRPGFGFGFPPLGLL